jgi:hypothetical protein
MTATTRRYKITCSNCGTHTWIQDPFKYFSEQWENKCHQCNQKFKSGNEGLEEQLIIMLQAGHRIEAMALHLETSGGGLKESKEFIDKFAEKHNIYLKKGCFIATACYGSHYAREVQLLRNYRDDVLLKTATGKKLVIAYYFISPPIAKTIEHSEKLKYVIRKYILAPLIRKVQKRNE